MQQHSKFQKMFLKFNSALIKRSSNAKDNLWKM